MYTNKHRINYKIGTIQKMSLSFLHFQKVDRKRQSIGEPWTSLQGNDSIMY